MEKHFVCLFLMLLLHQGLANAKADTITYDTRYGGASYVAKIGIVMTNTTLNAAISASDAWGPISLYGFQCWKWDRVNQVWMSTANWDDFSESWIPNYSISAGDALFIQTPSGCYVHQTGTRETGIVQITLPPGQTSFAIPEDTTLSGLCSSASFTPATGDQAWCGPAPNNTYQPMSSTCNWDDLYSPPVWIQDTDLYEGGMVTYRNASMSTVVISIDF